MAVSPLKGNASSVTTTTSKTNPGDRVASGGQSVQPIVAVLSRQMPLPQAQQLAGQTALVRVAKNGADNQTELEFNGQKISVKLPPGKSLTPGELITVSFALGDKNKADASEEGKSSKRLSNVNQLLNLDSEGEEEGQTTQQKSSSFVSKLSGAARLIGLLEKLGQPKNSAPFQASVSSRPIANLLTSGNNTTTFVKLDNNLVPDKLILSAQDQTSSKATLQNQTNAKPTTQNQLNANPSFQNQTNTNAQTQSQSNIKTAVNTQQLQANLTNSTTLTAKNTLGQQNSLVQQNKQSFSVNQTTKVDPATLATQRMSSALAQHVSQAVENSGLFYESHLQQWAKGDRSKAQLLLEPQARFGAEQVISDKNLDPNALNQSVRMVAHQLSALDQSRINISLEGLFPNPVEVEIEADKEEQQKGEQSDEKTRPWMAKLKLDMPTLGPIDVKLRMIGDKIDLALSAQETTKQVVDQQWRDIEYALEAKGLTLAHGQIRSVTRLESKDG